MRDRGGGGGGGRAYFFVGTRIFFSFPHKGLPVQLREDDPTFDLTSGRVDSGDAVALPYIGPHLSVDVLELVEPDDGLSEICYLQFALEGELRVHKVEKGCAVAADELLTIVCNAPSIGHGAVALRHLRATGERRSRDTGVFNRHDWKRIEALDTDLCKSGLVVQNDSVCSPEFLVESVLERSDSFAKVGPAEHTHANGKVGRPDKLVDQTRSKRTNLPCVLLFPGLLAGRNVEDSDVGLRERSKGGSEVDATRVFSYMTSTMERKCVCVCVCVYLMIHAVRLEHEVVAKVLQPLQTIRTFTSALLLACFFFSPSQKNTHITLSGLEPV